MITIDTSALLALFDARAGAHADVLAALRADPGPWLVPAATLGELGYFFEHRFSPAVGTAFLKDLARGAWTLDGGEPDVGRVLELYDRYVDLPLGVVDASVVACAERNGGRVLSLDRDFHVVAGEGTIEVFPAAS